MQKTISKEIVTYLCDKCGVEESHETTARNSWIFFMIVIENGIRLLEQKSARNAGRFRLPTEKEVCFCSTNCALNYLSDTTSLFLKELSFNQN